MNCTFVCGTIAVTARHLFNNTDGCTHILLRKMLNGGEMYTRVIGMDKITFKPMMENGVNKDVLFFSIDVGSIHRHPSIVKMFVSYRDLTRFYAKRFGVTSYVRRGKHLLIVSNFVTGGCTNVKVVVPASNLTIVNAITLAIPVQDGQCGSALYATSGKTPRRLYGIINAGSSGQSIASTITAEEIEFAIAQFNYKERIEIQDLGDSDLAAAIQEIRTKPKALTENQIVPLAHLALPNFSPDKTMIERSELYEEFGGAETRPVDLEKGENDVHNYAKYAHLPVDIPVDIMERFKANVRSRLQDATFELDDIEVAIRGDSIIKPINRSTSPGIPWTNICKGKGKTDLLGENENWKYAEILKNAVERTESRAKEGLSETIIWADCNKDVGIS